MKRGLSSLAGASRLCCLALLLSSACPAFAAEFKIVHTFTNDTEQNAARGWEASGQLTMDEKGALYGTTGHGGSACPYGQYSCGGTVYKLSRPKKGTTKWRHQVIARFKGGTDGAYPVGGVMRTPEGVLYGTTKYGGRPDCTYSSRGCGTVFELTPPSESTKVWKKAVLHRFGIREGDGRFPDFPPVRQGEGELYGTTPDGGGSANAGMMYLLTKSVPSVAAAGLRDAGSTGSDTLRRLRGLLSGPAPRISRATPDWKWSNKFGWAYSTVGGKPIDPDQCDEWGETRISGEANFACNCPYGFAGDRCCAPFPIEITCGGGSNARAAERPFRGRGNLYGAASAGGDDDCVGSGGSGCGVVFEFRRRKNGTYSYGVIYSFLGGSDGFFPNSKLTIGPDGSLYGTTLWGGRSCAEEPVPGRGCGTVYKLTPPAHGSGDPWTQRILYRFKGGDDGAFPEFGVSLLPDGALYGATRSGTVVKLRPRAEPNRPWIKTILQRDVFTTGPLIWDNDGALYGTTPYTVFKLTP